MRAIVRDRYGGPEVLEVRELDRPELRNDRLLIRIRAAALNRSDWESLTAEFLHVRLGGGGFLRPRSRTLGSDVAGVVEEVGADVTDFSVGDEVFGDILWVGSGAFAEYVSVPAQAPLARKPPSLTFELAAARPQAGGLALQALTEHGGVEAGQQILVNGAGGGAGSFAVQIAKALGAEVTGVDRGEKIDAMREAGAGHVVDYESQDFSKEERRYDRVIDFAGRRSILPFRRVLRPGGSYVMVGGSMPRLVQAAVVGGVITRLTDKSMRVMIAKPSGADLERLAEMVVDGQILPIIDRQCSLDEVPESLRDLGEGRVNGKVVVTL